MSTDVELQLVGDKTEEAMRAPDSPRSAAWGNGSCSSVKSAAAKMAKVLCIALGVAILMPFILAALASIIVGVITGFIGVIASVPISLVLVPLVYIIIFSFPRKTIWDRIVRKMKGSETSSGHGIGGMYNRARREQPLWSRIMLGSWGVIARASLGALVWLALSLLVPRLRAVTLLGSPMWKWSLLAVTLTAGYFQVLTIVVTLLFLFRGATSYYAASLFTNMNHVAYFGLAMGTWLGYFRTHHGLNNPHHTNPKAFEYVTWTFVSLFVCSVLFLFKNLLLLKWSANAIYQRFGPRILITSLKYYTIGLLAAGFDEKAIVEDLISSDDESEEGDNDDTTHNRLTSSTAVVSKYVMSRKMSLTHLGSLSRILISLANIMSPLLDHEHQQGDQEDVVTWFNQQINNDTSDPCTPDDLLQLFYNDEEGAKPAQSLSSRLRRYLRFLSDDDDNAEENESNRILENKKKLANVLWRLIGEEFSSAHTFTFDNLRIWMVDAHKDCINMGRTLADAGAMVTNLDIFMSFVIFFAILLLWLLITGVSSTTVLVTVATPFLALTFIFGDSAKTFFQGFIFCFATHPFDVGDRCILDEVELEVKSVSILTTTFIKIGSKEKRLYPNSELATKAIINLGWQPDSKDMVELLLAPSTNLDALEIKIKEFFEQESQHYGNIYSLVISDVGESIKVKINFSHILTVHDLSHSQCFKKKSLQRSNFLRKIKKYINELQIDLTVTKDPSLAASTTTTEIRVDEQK